jgi:hypothetical protein
MFRRPSLQFHLVSPALLIFALCLSLPSVGLGAEVPDFTKGEAQDPKHKKKKLRDKAMGPTGLWGQVYQLSMKKGATSEARQFLVTKVEEGSPADGKIEIGDVVLGASGQDFDDDARKQLAGAIQEAEATNGQLSLKVWREGTTGEIVLPLKVMGAYNPADPFNCAYTDGVIDQMVEHVLTVGLPSPDNPPVYGSNFPFMPTMYGLGLLATGNEELMPKVRDLAHFLCLDRSGKFIDTFEVSSRGKRVWHTSYKLIFLAEYYMVTGDEHVLPAIRTLAVGGAKGQSGVGSYGHRFSSRKRDDSYHGPLEGYGAINNAGLSMLTGLILASGCGIEHPEISAAIIRGRRFFDFFVEHGGIPYGDHWPITQIFENNGTSGLAAIAYGFMREDTGQRFFSSMAVGAAPTGREDGHQGSYWSYLWSGLGAARSGQEGLNAAFKETRYLRTLERGWNGQVIDQSNIGPTKYDSRGDVTGERLLLMSLGRENIYFTGKNMKVERPLEGQALADTLEGGRLVYDSERRKSLSEETIFRLLRHELPAVRIAAAKAMQEQKLDRVDRLIELINDPDRHARYGALNGLAYAGWNSEKAVDAILERILKDEDILFRYFAVDALSSGKGQSYGLHGAAAKAVPILLKLASEPAPDDLRGHLTWQISEALFYYKYGLFKAYPPESREAEELLLKSLEQFLLNQNGRARSQVPLESLTEDQLGYLWDSIIEAARTNAPGGVMFSKGVRKSSLIVLAQYRIKEGLDVMAELSKTWIGDTEAQKWVPWFAETMFAVLPLYGRDALPIIEIIEQWPVLEGRGKKLAEKLPALKEEIKNSPDYDLVSGRK